MGWAGLISQPTKHTTIRYLMVSSTNRTPAILFFLVLIMVGPVLLPTATQASDSRLLVFAAASLKNAMDAVVTAYESSHVVAVKVSYAGSSTLARQIQSGAPAQIYVSANQAWMNWLEHRGLIDIDSRVDLLRNSLVLVAPASSRTKLKISSGFNLRAALHAAPLAMANTDAVPAGIYGRQALEMLGIWESLQGRIAQASDVRGALALVARGEAPLGIVYASDAVAEDKVRVVDRFAENTHDRIVYPAAMLANISNPQAAEFMAFLQGDEAAAIFQRWGFELAGQP